MKKLVLLLIAILLVPLFTGCPGNSKRDIEVQEQLWAWIQEQDQNGWTITGYEVSAGRYKNIILDHKFRPTRLMLVIDGSAVNPFHQRNLLEDIARKWRDFYPANMRPRFNLKVVFYDKNFDRSNELGYTEIDKDGTVETHHGKTQDVI